MDPTMPLHPSLCFGYERLAAWSGLLDEINVFPVADADTGINLKISLSPLCWLIQDAAVLARGLMQAATGNSGNIAAAFFAELLKGGTIGGLGPAIHRGRQKAEQAVNDPQPGTMLSVFDALAGIIPADDGWKPNSNNTASLIYGMEKAVAATAGILPAVQQAGVVDAGALGVFICLEAFFAHLSGRSEGLRPVTDIFPGKLEIAAEWSDFVKPGESRDRYCINTLIESGTRVSDVRRQVSDLGRSLVLNEDAGRFKLHLHTHDRGRLRKHVDALGRVLAWSEEMIDPAALAIRKPGAFAAVHILTDAAGAITQADAAESGITLLNSYLVVEDRAWPETLFDSDALYAAMSAGRKVSTAQASLFEREQSYMSAVRRFEQVLYLCVGSAYTGNYQAARSWQARQGRENGFTVIDTGAASGRLGVIALAVARFARRSADIRRVIDAAHAAVKESEELVFLNQLKFLAAGGRISKTRGFFGDLLNMKPVISPTREGAVKVAVVRHRKDQLSFALERLQQRFASQDAPLILLQYSDNRSWVEETAAPQMQSLLPAAEIRVRPLSLTSGAHMGPGTWAVAFLPAIQSRSILSASELSGECRWPGGKVKGDAGSV